MKEFRKRWKKVKRILKKERNVNVKNKELDNIKFEVLVKAMQYLPNKEELYEEIIDIIVPYYIKLNSKITKDEIKSDFEMIAIRKLLSDLDINLFLLTCGKNVWRI